MKKVAVFIDGVRLRAYPKSARRPFTADFIVTVAKAAVQAGEEPFRIRISIASRSGTVKPPVSGASKA